MQKKRTVGVTDTTLRDAHQSLWATRMRTEDMLPIVERLDRVGYRSLEMWGGATFDVCLRFLSEDPWQRLRLIRKHVKHTPLQMLLRGQNLVGYKHYPDDVVERFVSKAVENGIEIVRVFDALNDVQNVAFAMQVAKRSGAHVQAAVVYTISPVHSIEHYVETATKLEEQGADSICVKDMAGLLSPYGASELVARLKGVVRVPVQVHCHYIGGYALMTYLKAIEAGADAVDTASAPLAFGASQPPVETLVGALRGSEVDTGLDLEELFEIARYWDEVRRRRGFDRGVTRITDMKVFGHQVPGGMISNLVTQLEQQKSLNRLPEVLEEIPRVREELGYPPLVTPTSQIVGIQAVLNVLVGERYKIVPDEVRAYARGLYGKPPAPVREELRTKLLRGALPVEGRPADTLPPQFARIQAELKGVVHEEEDLLSYALFPQIATEYFASRTQRGTGAEESTAAGEGKEGVGMGINIDEIKELIKILDQTDVAELNLESEGVKICIRKGVAIPGAHPAGQTQAAIATAAGAPAGGVAEGASRGAMSPSSGVVGTDSTASGRSPRAAAEAETGAWPVTVDMEDEDSFLENERYQVIRAPMVGTFYRAPAPDAPPYVDVGMDVRPGEILCIIEAMKLMNEIESDVAGRVARILVENAQPVEYGKPLLVIERFGEDA